MHTRTLVFLGGLLAGLATPILMKRTGTEFIQPAVASTETVLVVENRKVLDEREVMCMALNLYHEARGESKVGRRAVMHVVKNRAEADGFGGDTICDVVMAGKKDSRGRILKGKCQFSWTCDFASDVPKDLEKFEQLEKEARNFLMNERIDDITEGATYYHSVAVKPSWDFDKTTRIDQHIFYR